MSEPSGGAGQRDPEDGQSEQHAGQELPRLDRDAGVPGHHHPDDDDGASCQRPTATPEHDMGVQRVGSVDLGLRT